jgi:hypothetical protein
MGFDKLLNFISKNLNFDSIEEFNIEANVKKIITNNIMVDVSFLIYQTFLEIEDDINNIIKIILSLPFNFSNNLVQEKILGIFMSNHWTFLNLNCNEIFDGNNEEEIIKKFINYLSKEKINEHTILNNVIAMNLYEKIQNNLTKLHNIELIKYINIIFDGIPSYSKILEQRRRRIRNHIESNERKKKYDQYFKNKENTFEEYDSMSYDYFKWLKNRFTIDKSFGPISSIIIFLEEFIYKKLTVKFPNIKIIINQGKNNGEADYKIFKSIYEKEYNGDLCIHTIDSDLVHQILVQQNYFNLTKKDITLSVIRYNYKNNNIQYIEANTIIKNIEKCYNNYSQSFNKKIIYDICLILLFFGNDHLPSSFEIGPELNLEYLLKIHHTVFKNNKTIVDLVNDEIVFSFENFKLYLKEIYIKNEINKTKIIITRYFKLNYNLLNYLTDKLELIFPQILQTCRKILFDSGKSINEIDTTILDSDDLRYKLINKYDKLDFPPQIDKNKTINKQEMNMNFEKILLILDKTCEEDKFCGLPLYSKMFYLSDDNNQNIYNIFIEDITEDLEKQYKLIFDYKSIEDLLYSNEIIDINEDSLKCYAYLKKVYHLVKTLFGNMKYYNCNNFTYYKYYETPTLYSLINFLEKNSNISFEQDILNENVNSDNYFNSINHYIIITPNLKTILWKFDSVEFSNLVNSLMIDNLWFDNDENFKFKDIDIKEFFKNWSLVVFNNNINQYKKYELLNNEIYLIGYENLI